METGETSVEVRIEGWAKGRGRGKAPEEVTEGVFTFVAIGGDGQPRPLATGEAES